MPVVSPAGEDDVPVGDKKKKKSLKGSSEWKLDREAGRPNYYGFQAPREPFDVCCVTPGLRDPSCPALAYSCPGNQGSVIQP